MRKHSKEGHAHLDARPDLLRSSSQGYARSHVTLSADEFSFGSFVLRTDRRELTCEGTLRPMERRTFDLLVYLIRNAGRVVTKEELLDHVWSNRHVTLSVIAQSVLKVRKALQRENAHDCPVRTVHRIGYRWVGEVRHRVLPVNESTLQPSTAQVQWQSPRLVDIPDAPPWLASALGAFGAWALQSCGVGVSINHPSEHQHNALATVTTCSLTLEGESYTATVQMRQAGGQMLSVADKATSPFEAVWRAAGSAAYLLRLRQVISTASADESDRRWERLAALTQLEPHPFADRGPALSRLWNEVLANSTLGEHADLLMEAAWRADPETPQEAIRLRQRAVDANEPATAGWADLCLAVHEWHAGDGGRVLHLVERAMREMGAAGPASQTFRARAIAGHLLTATQGGVTPPAWWLPMLNSNLSDVPGPLRRWRRLSIIERHLSRDENTRLDGPVITEAPGSIVQGAEGLHAMALALSARVRLDGADIESALREATAAFDHALRSPWVAPRMLCAFTLGNLAARLGERFLLERTIHALDDAPVRDMPRWQAIHDWLCARRAQQEGQHQAVWRLVERALPVMGETGIWFGEEDWLFAVDSALRVASANALEGLRARMEESTPHLSRTRTATRIAAEASLALLSADRGRAHQLMVRAWQTAPPSTTKRLLAMAALTTWPPVGAPTGQDLAQATLQCGAWLDRTPAGRRLRQQLATPAHMLVVSHRQGDQQVSDSGGEPYWLWAA